MNIKIKQENIIYIHAENIHRNVKREKVFVVKMNAIEMQSVTRKLFIFVQVELPGIFRIRYYYCFKIACRTIGNTKM